MAGNEREYTESKPGEEQILEKLDFVGKQVSLQPLLKKGEILGTQDEATVMQLADILCDEEQANFKEAAEVAAQALNDYRRKVRQRRGAPLVEALPVAKAVPVPETGGGRFYWRVSASNGCMYPATGHLLDHPGNLLIARRKALELYVAGVEPVELIPPDYDPQNHAEMDRQRNTAGKQEPGLTVRQRTKKH